MLIYTQLTTFKMIQMELVLGIIVLTHGEAGRADSEVPMLDGKIVGGKDTTIEEHPYQLSLENKGRHTCGASLIKPNVALTAAHCTDGRTHGILTVRAGTTIREKGGKVAKVTKICQHPKYSSPKVDYDVSVLMLDKSFATSSVIRPISLQPSNRDVPPGAMGIVTGWGTLSSGGSLPSKLQAVEVPRVSQKNCSVAYPKEHITDRMICFGYTDGGKDSCQGDSGGPLVVDGEQVGVVSWGYGCARPEFPGVYAKVANKEIQDHIGSCFGQ